ncbi:hypothetical protein TNCV_106201 [Trichonephila clavipes]|nr:hypothetical protein TNCV_106201 [Trichonephila clavipes]
MPTGDFSPKATIAKAATFQKPFVSNNKQKITADETLGVQDEKDKKERREKKKRNLFYLPAQEGRKIPFIFHIFPKPWCLSYRQTLVSHLLLLVLIAKTPAGKSQLIFEHPFPKFVLREKMGR